MEEVTVFITHKSGVQFQVHLSSGDYDRIITDKVYLEKISNKYYDLYKRGLVFAQSEEYVPNIENRAMEEDEDTDGDSIELNSEVLPSHSSQTEKFIWPRPAVLLLLDELEKRKRNLKLPHKKRILFGSISKCLKEKGYNVSWECCSRKWKGLQATYKNISEKESRSGAGNRSSAWDFYKRMEDILADDPAYTPLVTAAAGVVDETSTLPQALGITAASPDKTKANRNPQRSSEFSEINSNINDLKSSIDRMINVQTERNAILDRLTAAIETFTNSRNNQT